MGIAGTALGLGVGLASIPGGSGWSKVGAIIDADFAGGRYFFGGRNYPDETAWLAAIGGSKAGIARTIGPYLVGTELCADPGFDGGVDGWATVSGYAGAVSNAGGRLRAQKTAPGTAYRAMHSAFTTVAQRAYRWKLDYKGRSGAGTGSASVNASQDNGLSGSAAQFIALMDTPQSCTPVVASESTTTYAGMVMSVVEGQEPWTEWDDQSFRECLPYPGHQPGALSFELAGSTPAVASGNKVAAQWGEDRERNRVRLVWDSAKALRLIVTASNVEVANLNLGVVEVGTPFRVKASLSTNRFSACLDGNVVVTDVSGTMPGIGKFWIGRSPTGETWDGSIGRVTVWPMALPDAALSDAKKSLMVFGDSTADAGIWRSTLASGYSPARTIVENAAGGENSGQLLAKVVADSDHRQWTTIFMDLPNTGETFDYWMSNINAAVALLGTNRWYVHPPAQNSPSGTPLNGAAVVTAIQQALLSDPFFAGHTLAAAEQASYLTAVNDDATRSGSGDFTHFNAAGQAIQAAAIRAFLDGRGW